MRLIALRKLLAVLALLAAVAVLALTTASTPALAADSGSACQPLPSLTHQDLCVSVQAESSSVQPGATAGYVVGVSVTSGTALDVTVSIDASAGSPAFTTSCIVGASTSHCWIATMGLLGSPSSDQMQAQVPAGAAGSAETLTATAVVPTLVPWTPPSASASMNIATPTVASSPAPSASPAPSRVSSTTTSSSSSSHTSSSTATSSAPAAGSGSSALPGGSTGTVPAGFTAAAGTASGLFPAITHSPTPAPQGKTEEADPVADSSGVPLGQIAMGIGVALLVGWAAVVGPGLYRRKRSARKAS
jgi:hypothetical protein